MAKNNEVIEKIYQLNEEVDELLGRESLLYKKAMLNNEDELEIKRGKKKKEKIQEKYLWEELRITGLRGDVCDALKKKYPELIETAMKREAKVNEMRTYILANFGFDFNQMKIADYMKLTDALIAYNLSKRNIFKRIWKALQ
jgi:GTPase involved in cell partitioning and DNA repair